MFQNPERQARMFERELRTQIPQHMISQRFPTLREVADAALALEHDIAGGKEAATKANQAAEKEKNKRPFVAV
jgi:hypothetical protein